MCVPALASAHAVPVESVPEQSSVSEHVPDVVSIRFTERIDAKASAIVVRSSDNTVVSGPTVRNPQDTRELSVPLVTTAQGAYRVTWSVVSSDDGHYTRGEYPIFVGAAPVGPVQQATSEVVQIATTPEILAMTLELTGNGILWALLLIVIIGLRRVSYETRRAAALSLERAYAIGIGTGIGAGVIGGILQIGVKTAGLAEVRLLGFWDALPLYVQTTAGAATVGRIGLLLVVGCVWWIGRRAILSANKITAYEYVIGGLLLAFALLRSVISHATANHFFPEVSVLVNVLHLVEKDLWAGTMLVLLGMVLIAKLRDVVKEMLPRVYAMLAIDVALIGVTASYIVWLHLKSFENLWSTEWGGVFLNLALCAAVLLALRVYHAGTRSLRGSTLGLECAAALMVVYCSSVVIVTSPPLPIPDTPVYRTLNEGVTMMLERDRYEDGMMLLTVQGAGASEPVFTIVEHGQSEPIVVRMVKKFDGGYSLPQAVFAGTSTYTAELVVPRADGYDAHASWEVDASKLAPTPGWEGRRSMDAFTATWILLALCAAGLGGVLYYVSASDVVHSSIGAGFARAAVAGLLIGMFALGNATAYAQRASLFNHFKFACEDAGNMWHVMVPMRAGVPLSQTPHEGCMWGMGRFTYFVADKREYDSKTKLDHAEVTLATMPGEIVAGRPTRLVVKVAEADGAPAPLSIDMERLVHMVIVSEDQSTFAHIHADDLRPLTPQEIAASRFTFEHVFPKAGKYIVAINYAHGFLLESQTFVIDVAGGPEQNATPVVYPLKGKFGGYDVELKYTVFVPGEVSTMKFTVTKNGVPVTAMEPWLAAAMHVAVVKNDLSSFQHVHGEVHPLGTPPAPVRIKNGQVVHSMASMVVPERFGPDVEVHTVFPERGVYTLWAQFKVGDTVVPASFTVRAE